MRVLAIAVLVVATARPAIAEDAASKEIRIRGLLASEAPLDVAWGLQGAIVRELPGLGEELRRILAHWQHDLTWTGREIQRAAVDAALSLGVDLPAQLVRASAPAVGETRTLLLASRSPVEYRDLLRCLLDVIHDDDGWTATCNLLLPLKDPVLTAHLLRRLRLEVSLTARDPIPPAQGWQLGCSLTSWSGTGCARVPPAEVPGWPPRRAWQLRTSWTAGALPFAPGRRPVWALLGTLEEGGFACRAISRRLSQDSVVEHLADLLGLPSTDLGRSLHDHRHVPFSDLAAWDLALESARRDRRRQAAALLLACTLRGLLSLADALTIVPHIDVQIHDERTVQDPPLPSVPAR